MKHLIPHDLDMPTAKKVADHAFAEYKGRYPEYQPQLRWVSDALAEITFNAKGIKLNGSFGIEPGNIALDLDVPFLLRPFKSKAIEVIEREVKVWLVKAKAGEM